MDERGGLNNDLREKTPLTHNRVHKKHFAIVDVRGELCVVDLCFVCLLVTLYEDLADTNRAAAVSQALLHRLSCSATGKHTMYYILLLSYMFYLLIFDLKFVSINIILYRLHIFLA